MLHKISNENYISFMGRDFLKLWHWYQVWYPTQSHNTIQPF